MALDNAALLDLRSYVRKRVSFIRYFSGETYREVPISDAEILSSGVVRIAASIVPEKAITITRVELYNNNGDRWAYQDCNITIDNNQTGVLYWFDFTIKEGT